MITIVQPRQCANPGCPNSVPATKPGHRAKLTCSDRCRKAASRYRQQEAARQQEEAAKRVRLERWQAFLPTTRRSLERLEVLAGARLAEELAEAIRSELAKGRVTAEWRFDDIARAASPSTTEASGAVPGGR